MTDSRMKRTGHPGRKKSAALAFALAALFALVLPVRQYAGRYDIYVLGGMRTVNSADIKNVYGNGAVYYPAVFIEIWKGLGLGAGYEGGYSRDGLIGIYEEATTLKISGFEIFAAYELGLEHLGVFARAGYGNYGYKQFIDNPNLPYEIDDRKSTVVLAGGLKFLPVEKFFFIVEVKYVPLKVKPVEDEVDLGGMRLLGGLGLRF